MIFSGYQSPEATSVHGRVNIESRHNMWGQHAKHMYFVRIKPYLAVQSRAFQNILQNHLNRMGKKFPL